MDADHLLPCEPTDIVCPLDDRQQKRNMLLFAANTSLIYLGGSVVYVGITEAALCQKLGTSAAMANLPATAFGFGSLVPVFVAWYFPSVRMLKPLLAISYVLTAAAGMAMTALLLLSAPARVVVWGLVGYGLVVGAAMQIIGTLQFEVLGRGMSAVRRSQTLWLAYAVGPVIALVGSLVSQVVLAGQVELPYVNASLEFGLRPFTFPIAGFPLNFAILFAASVPMMAMCALNSMTFVIPRPAQDLTRQPFVTTVFGGIGEILRNPTIRIASLATILIFGGNMILSNISLYTQQILGVAAEQYVGYQNALRFGCKIISGALIGWLLTRTNPKSALVATALVGLTGVLWAAVVPGKWFMVSFGLLGAGELFATYYPNYILSCSPASKMRRNMAFTYMLPLIASPAGWMFGKISDIYGQDHRPSFVAAMVILAATLALVVFALPARPRPRREDMDATDMAFEPQAADVPVSR